MAERVKTTKACVVVVVFFLVKQRLVLFSSILFSCTLCLMFIGPSH